MFDRRVIREGFIAGVLGASAVALWFFIADLVAGQPLYTPLLLASAAAAVFGGELGGAVAMPVAAYTVFHYAAFIGFGIMLTKLLAASKRSPGHFAGMFLMFAVLEVGFYFVVFLLSMLDEVGALAWYQIGAANLLAALVMGTYLWRRYPEAVRGLDAALKGTTP